MRVLLAMAVVLVVFALVTGAMWLEANPIPNPFYAPVQAAGGDVPPCVPIGETGNIVISRCVDEENGQILYVNNIGFIAVQP